MNGFTNYEEMFAQSIGLREPWYVERAEFEEEKREVHIYVKARKTAKYPCPECGDLCERYDDEEDERIMYDISYRRKTFSGLPTFVRMIFSRK